MAKSGFNKGDLWKWALGFGIAGIGYVAYDYFIRKPAKEKAAFGKTDIYSQQAIAFRNAMNPSGNGPMSSFDGTDEQQLFKIAGKVTNFSKVADSYYDMYHSNLSNEIQSELSSKDLEKFNKILKQNKK